MATLEALWLGIPVLTTHECNFREIEGLECTFVVRPSVASIAEGLVAMLGHSAAELRARGERCRDIRTFQLLMAEGRPADGRCL